MKRLVAFMFVMCLLLTFVPAYTIAENKNESLNDNAHQFSVVPRTEEWKSLKNVIEKREACYVPLDELENMSTPALIETIINYPLLVDIYVYNSIDEGINALSNYFFGIQVLSNRENALEMLKSYNKENCDSLTQMYLNTLIAFFSSQQQPQYYRENYYRDFPDITTPNSSIVPVYVYIGNTPLTNILYNRSWSDCNSSLTQEQQIAASLQDIYTSAVLVQQPSPKYNCHSYAWHNQTTGNKYWINFPDIYIDDGSYVFKDTPAANRKITYKPQNSLIYSHSGIVVTAGSSDSTTTIVSKWGYNATFRHKVDDCPYYSSTVRIKYWKKNV